MIERMDETRASVPGLARCSGSWCKSCASAVAGNRSDLRIYHPVVGSSRDVMLIKKLGCAWSHIAK